MIRVNLLKAEKKEIEERPAAPAPGTKEKKKTPTRNIIIFLAIILLGVIAYKQKRAIDSERELLGATQEEQKKLQPVLAKLELVEFQKMFLVKKINLINQLKAQQGTAVKIMEELSQSLPEWVWLTEISFNKQSVQIKGKALSNVQISDYISNLEKSGLFNGVGLIGSTQRSAGNNQFLEFTLVADLVPSPGPKPQDKAPAQANTTELR
jgi:Tfp pilus assembly protein PilN